MYRFAQDQLQKWLLKSHRKPLILRGARQTGKSTLVRLFAKAAGLELLEINLEKNKTLDSIFASLDLGLILPALQSAIGKSFPEQGALLFLDEIQATPHAIAALRYFHEEKPELPVIAAGSLLEFVLNQHDFSMPVGRVEFFHLGPMTFREYLLAQKQDIFEETVRKLKADPSERVDNFTHQKLIERWKRFLWVGGMPEAVHVESLGGSQEDVRSVHRSIMDTYEIDFPRYSRSSQQVRVERIFRYVPGALGQKVKYSNISRDEQSRDLRTAIELLAKAKVVLPVFHAGASGLPLSATVDSKTYKLYFLDVGLAGHAMGLQYADLLMSDPLLTQGRLVEQFVAQSLCYGGEGWDTPELYYWLREGKKGNAEVDFVMAQNSKILPVEVKSNKSGSLRSLHLFCHEKKIQRALRYDLNPPSLQRITAHVMLEGRTHEVRYDLQSLPLYCA